MELQERQTYYRTNLSRAVPYRVSNSASLRSWSRAPPQSLAQRIHPIPDFEIRRLTIYSAAPMGHYGHRVGVINLTHCEHGAH